MGGVSEQERPKAELAARKALELDPESAEAHVLMASIAEHQWHWAESKSEYHRALELRPNDAGGYSGLAWWLECQGCNEEALTMRRRARELDPLAISGAELGWDLFYARRYAKRYKSCIVHFRSNQMTPMLSGSWGLHSLRTIIRKTRSRY